MAFVNILKHYCTTWSTNQEQEGSIYLGFALKWRFEKKAWISGDLGGLKAFRVQRNKCTVEPSRNNLVFE